MKDFFTLVSLVTIFSIHTSCIYQQEEKSKQKALENQEATIAKETIENYNIQNDSTRFNSATIENFAADGRSIDVYWINNKRDTILRFFRKYDENNQLIGAEYFEEGDTLPSRDTVYYSSDGFKIEASLNEDNQITWKSTIHTDSRGNEILRTYENGKGEYRGLDSLYFDDQNREIKGFYKNAKGKKYGVRTYEYIKEDEFQNWTERNLFVNDTLNQKQLRKIEYHN